MNLKITNQFPKVNIDDVMPDNKNLTKCAPHLEFENGSCIPLDLLVKMAKAYNEYIANNKKSNQDLIQFNSNLNSNSKSNLNLDTHSLSTSQQNELKKYLLYQFKNKFQGEQKDWINSKYLELLSEDAKDELENNVFRPEGPQGRFEWLSTLDINRVLYQYEKKYDGFKFLGAVPIDFMDLNYLPFKKLKFSDLEKEGISKFGIIFNTDKSYQSGKHWISLYSDLKNGHVYFSDSVGKKPPAAVEKYMSLIEAYLKKKKLPNIDVRYNKTPHQQGNSECGVYSINFIIRLLKGKSFDHITRKRLKDEKINKCRTIYFGNVDKSQFN